MQTTSISLTAYKLFSYIAVVIPVKKNTTIESFWNLKNNVPLIAVLKAAK